MGKGIHVTEKVTNKHFFIALNLDYLPCQHIPRIQLLVCKRPQRYKQRKDAPAATMAAHLLSSARSLCWLSDPFTDRPSLLALPLSGDNMGTLNLFQFSIHSVILT